MQVSNILRSGKLTEASLKGKIQITRLDSSDEEEESDEEENKEDEEENKEKDKK